MSQKTAKAIARVIAVILVAALVITTFTFVFSWADSNEDVYFEKELRLLKDLIVQTKADYKDNVSYETLISGAYKGILDSLDDPYSIYYITEEESSQFEESVSGEFSGIGVSLEQLGGQARVVSPIAGGPAERAGIISGDVIVGVDGKDVNKLSLDDVVALLRGEAGTKVSLTIDRQGKALSFTLIREKIKLTTVSFKMLQGNIGYIGISQFAKNTHLEFKSAKLQLLAQGAGAFIVDVRNNPGGYVDVAADIAEQMMAKGPVLHFQKQGEIVETIYADGAGDLKKPVIVLINEGSASASEILAAAWQDSGTAKLVGTNTYGKGVAQQIFTRKDGRKLKLSTYYFLSPNKNTIDKVGISPDYLVKNYQVSGKDIKEDLLKEYEGFAPMVEKSKPKVGDIGLNVFGAQQRLSLLGYTLSLTGKMDETMFKHIKSFQKETGLYPYGVLDYSTMAMLDKVTIKYITGADTVEDLQLKKAIELLQ